jgi:hypothetical protein
MSKVVSIKSLRVGPSDFQKEVQRLEAMGKMPSLPELLSVIAEVRAEYAPRIIAARKRGKK